MIFKDTNVSDEMQIPIPLEILRKFDVGPGDIVEWTLGEDGTVRLNFRKRISFEDMRGAIRLSHRTDAVELERDLYNH